jgi:hypothetical protein
VTFLGEECEYIYRMSQKELHNTFDRELVQKWLSYGFAYPSILVQTNNKLLVI